MGINILRVARGAFSRLLLYIPCPLGEGNATGLSETDTEFMMRCIGYMVTRYSMVRLSISARAQKQFKNNF